jgi:multidrug resistance protein
MRDTSDAGEGTPPARGRLIIAAMLVSTFMAAVEVTVIGTAMPTIVAKLGGFSLFSWAFGIYLLAQAVTTPLYGRLADSYGRRRVYLGCTALFLVGSLLCGLSWSMMSLIVFRGIQGIGGGGLVPMATTIIGDVAPPADRPRMMGYVSGIWGIAAVVGPLLGAFFVGTLGWPFVFWVNIPIGLITMTMVYRYLHEPREAARPASIDLPAAGLLVVGIGAIMGTLVQLHGMSGRSILLLLALGAVALTGFAWRERVVTVPLLPLHLWRRPLILAANSSAVLCGAILIGFTAFLPTWSQGVAGRSALVSGIILGVMTVAWTSSAIGVGRVMGRLSYRFVAVGAAAAVVIGCLAFLELRPGPIDWVWMGLACIFTGAGLGVTSLVFVVAVQSSVEREDRARATALFYFSRLMGQALGAAAFGGVLNAGLAHSGVHDAARDLVDPILRRALAPETVARLVGLLAAALHNVFVLGVILGVGALVAASLVPRAARLPKA